MNLYLLVPDDETGIIIVEFGQLRAGSEGSPVDIPPATHEGGQCTVGQLRLWFRGFSH